MTCEFCQHWIPPDPADAKVGCKTGVCKLTYGFDYEPENPQTKAFCLGPIGESVVLSTDSDFGCVQFSAKEIPA